MKIKIVMTSISVLILIVIIGIFMSSINSDTSNFEMFNNDAESANITNTNEDIDDDNSETEDNTNSTNLITAQEEYDGYFEPGRISFLEHGVSDILREKLNDPEAKEYNYRTIVHILQRADENYSNPGLELEIKEAQDNFNNAYEEYNSIPMENVGSDVTGEKGREARRVFEELTSVWGKEVRALGHELYLLESEYEELSKSNYINEKVDFAKELGAKNVKSIASSSDERDDIYGKGFFMELTYDNIEKMEEQDGYIIRLALPERVDNYDVKIADSLTILLEELDESETIHVAVVSRIDADNRFARRNSLAVNNEYNRHLFRDFDSYEEYEQSYAGVEKYISDILIRNEVEDKRIDVKENVSIYWNPDSIVAGFEAELTRDEIIKLAQDDEVKVIYPMKYKVFISLDL